MNDGDTEPAGTSGEAASVQRTGPADPRAEAAGQAPDLLADAEERRKRDRVRAALFGEPAEPEKIGRFTLLGRLGAGGMGVVYAARDEQLGREVAVKLLRSRPGSGETERDRLLREAQSMARLAHPNVVTVYEVGFHGDQLFLAMERVRGQTVSAWLREAKRGFRDVLAVFLQAGRGLAAAHAAGLVHRDFKPDNVMLGEGGAVKVRDFGLARPAGEAQPAAVGGPRVEGAAVDRRLTETGAILGTPAYMAPEQFTGGEVDARTDQYAFCVSLHEALHGERPRKGDSIEEEARAAIEGRIEEPPAGSDVPSWVRRAVLRGLAVKPDDRWPSMQALLTELANDPAAKRRRWARAAIGLVLGGTAIAVTAYLSRGTAPPVCEGGPAEIGEVWGPDARAAGWGRRRRATRRTRRSAP